MSVETLKLCGLLILLAPLAGAILAGGLGPSFIYDLEKNRPKPPLETETEMPQEG